MFRPLAAARALFVARWPSWRGAGHDAAREDQRRALAHFLAAPGGPLAGSALAGAAGFAGTPGIGDAIRGQRLAFADPPDHAGAAEAFHDALRAMPDIEDDATDATRQARLAQALGLMLLAHHAVKAGLADRRWGRFGTAEMCAARAVAQAPLLIYLRFEQAELMRLLGRRDEAFSVIRQARPLATEPSLRLRLADTAGEIAAQSADAGDPGGALLLAAAESEFIAPLLAAGKDDGPPDPPADDPQACDWAWWVAFRAGKVALTRARLPGPRDAAAAGHAQRAARCFSRALSLMGSAATPVREEHRLNLAEWRRQALREAAELLLSLGMARDAERALAAMDTDEHRAMAAALSAWRASGRGDRFAAAALIGTGEAASLLAFPALAEATRELLDPARAVRPPPAEPVVVAVNDPLLMDEALAHAIIAGPEEPTIAALRERMNARFRFRLPGVRLRGVDDPAAPRRITINLAGRAELSLTAPEDAVLALASPEEARRAGLAPLADAAPAVNDVACAWVAAGGHSDVVALRHPAYAIVGALETALLRALPRLVGLDDAAAALPYLTEALLPRALSALRLLHADRMPIDDAVLSVLRAGLEAGESPEALVHGLRLLPGIRPMLWGNEAGRRPVRPAQPLVRAILAEAGRGIGDANAAALAEAVGEGGAPVLLARAAERQALRAALRHPPRAHAWLADIPVLAEAEWRGAA